MALTKCPDCGKELSDMAPACPECGRPMQAMTMEATGKKYKIMQLLGVFLMLFGIVGVVSFVVTGPANPQDTPSSSSLTIFAGMLMYIGARFGAWWNHG